MQCIASPEASLAQNDMYEERLQQAFYKMVHYNEHRNGKACKLGICATVAFQDLQLDAGLVCLHDLTLRMHLLSAVVSFWPRPKSV